LTFSNKNGLAIKTSRLEKLLSVLLSWNIHPAMMASHWAE
jgi:hypothetical protein